MKISKKSPKCAESKGLTLDQVSPLMRMGITLKPTEINKFLIKMDYLYTV